MFSVDFDWICFEDNIRRMCTRYDAWIIAYAWMTNHFHMIIELAHPSALPNAMRDFQSRYAAGYNLRTQRTGSLFERPYFSKPITDDAQLLQSARYVHRNPIDIVGAGRLASYRWSSLGVYLNQRSPESWLVIDRVERLIDSSRYLARLRGPHVWDRLPIDRLPPLVRATVDEIVEQLDLRSDRLSSVDRRNVCLHIAALHRAATPTELGERFDMHPVTVRSVQRRVRVRAAADPEIEALVNDVLIAIGSSRN